LGGGRNKAERIGYLSPFETLCITPLLVIPGLTRNPVQSWIAASAGISILMYIAEFGGQQCNNRAQSLIKKWGRCPIALLYEYVRNCLDIFIFRCARTRAWGLVYFFGTQSSANINGDILGKRAAIDKVSPFIHRFCEFKTCPPDFSQNY
jgi:hypothetical protein